MNARSIIIIILIYFAICGTELSAQTAAADTSGNHRSSPTKILLRSALVPGWGQYYNGKYIKGAIFTIGESYLFYGIWRDWQKADNHYSNFKAATDITIKASEFSAYTKYRDRRNIKLWILAATIFYSMFDAYVDAQLTDFDQRDKAYEVFISPRKDDGIMLGIAFKFQ